MNVGAWLRLLGLGQYELAFRENDIDAELLLRLTGEDLKDLGVSSVGHRRILLDAVTALHGGFATPTRDDAVVAEQDPAPVAPSLGRGGERRQVTVVFCDLVGSTELAARLDPEDYREALRAYQQTCASAITRYSGHVAKYMGDGVLAYFGYPQAHEDEASRALQAGLSLVQDVGHLTLASNVGSLRVRVGIATGTVVVGDLIGEGSAQEQAVTGTAPNLAARLQELAEPDTVVIAASTRRLVGGEFELEEIGPKALKGFTQPLLVWRVLGSRAVESRFEARTGGVTQLIGREEEIALLLNRWERTKEGKGQVVLLSGEPGIGKSRIAKAFHERLDGEPYVRLSHQCSPYYANSALRPTIEHLERAARLHHGDPPELKLTKLENLLAQGTDKVAQVTPLVAALLSVSFEGRYPPLALTPQEKKEKTIEILVDQALGLAEAQPVLWIFEDLHWADPTTLEMLNQVIERTASARMLLLLTFRPEFMPSWRGRPHVTAVSLNRLSHRQSAALVEKVAEGTELPESVLEQILTKTEGVPLFVEELTKSVLELGSESLTVPASLHDSLMARLDRYPLVKEVAQVAACIGREFDQALLSAVAELDPAILASGLDQLVRAELAFPRTASQPNSFVFKHALVRDVAYGSLLKSKRQQVHARIVGELKRRFAVSGELPPELLAQHCAEAGMFAEAIDYWRAAGERALSRAAMIEAATHFASAVALVPRLTADVNRNRHEAVLQTNLAHALGLAHGYTHQASGTAYRRAIEICRDAGLDDERQAALYGLFVFHLNCANLTDARSLAEEQLHLAERSGDPKGLLIGARAMGTVLMWLGDLSQARLYQERALYLFNARRDRQQLGEFQHDVLVSILSNLAWILLLLGFPDQASRKSAGAVSAARELAHPTSLAVALHRSCQYHQLLRDLPSVRDELSELRTLANRYKLPFFLAFAEAFEGLNRCEDRQWTEAIECTRHAVSIFQTNGIILLNPYLSALLVEVLMRGGLVAEATAVLKDAVEQVETTNERWLQAELQRISGELLLSTGKTNEAARCFTSALSIARPQQARWWELRAAIMLTRLWADHGERQKAYNLLAPVYGGFTEGFNTQDLVDAKTLLEKLR